MSCIVRRQKTIYSSNFIKLILSLENGSKFLGKHDVTLDFEFSGKESFLSI